MEIFFHHFWRCKSLEDLFFVHWKVLLKSRQNGEKNTQKVRLTRHKYCYFRPILFWPKIVSHDKEGRLPLPWKISIFDILFIVKKTVPYALKREISNSIYAANMYASIRGFVVRTISLEKTLISAITSNSYFIHFRHMLDPTYPERCREKWPENDKNVRLFLTKITIF